MSDRLVEDIKVRMGDRYRGVEDRGRRRMTHQQQHTQPECVNIHTILKIQVSFMSKAPNRSFSLDYFKLTIVGSLWGLFVRSGKRL